MTVSTLRRARPCRSWAAVVLALTVSACDGNDAPSSPPSESIRTLAYVVTDCVETGVDQSPVGVQRLLVQQGEAEPVTVASFPIMGPPSPFGLCAAFGVERFGPQSVVLGVFQRLAVSPDASMVVFEVTDDLALCNPDVCFRPPPLPPESKGIFIVGADGVGARRLGPPSQVPVFFTGPSILLTLPSLDISPNGQLATLTDLGVGSDAIERTQILTLDLTSGARRQLTRLPDAPETDPDFPATCCPGFFDDQTVSFASTADTDGQNPDNDLAFFTVDIDGRDTIKVPSLVELPDGAIDPTFTISKGRPSATIFFLGEAQEGPPGQIQEVLLIEGENLLQLTNLGRSDTTNPVLSNDGLQVFFVASADPLGTNPTNNCQVFSIDTTGTNLRQLTNFSEVGASEVGCLFAPADSGCAIGIDAQDTVTGTLILYSNCDPFGTNPDGGQIFTMQPDGGGLRQLTDAAGLVVEEGLVAAELPGPTASAGSGQ